MNFAHKNSFSNPFRPIDLVLFSQEKVKYKANVLRGAGKCCHFFEAEKGAEIYDHYHWDVTMLHLRV